MVFITAKEKETRTEILQTTPISVTYYILNVMPFITCTQKKISNANANIVHFKYMVDNQ